MRAQVLKDDITTSSTAVRDKGHSQNLSSTGSKNLDLHIDKVVDNISSTKKKETMKKRTSMENEFNDTVSSYMNARKTSVQTDSYVTDSLRKGSYTYSDMYCKEVSDQSEINRMATFSSND